MSQQTLDGHHINPEDLKRVLGYVFSDALKTGYLQIHPREYHNLATDTVDKHAKSHHPKTTALICRHSNQIVETYSYSDLSDLSNRFALFLKSLGVGRGDVVASLCNQGFQTAIAQLGAYKIGAIFAPFPPIYRQESIIHALNDCQAKVVITQRSLWDWVGKTPDLFNTNCIVIVSGQCSEHEVPFVSGFATPARDYTAEATSSDEPVILLYNFSIDGKNKGVLKQHQLLQNYLASAHLLYELDLDDTSQTVWTVSEWSWIPGILSTMLTSWYFGHTVEAVSYSTELGW